MRPSDTQLPDFSDRPQDLPFAQPPRSQFSLLGLLIIVLLSALLAALLRGSGLPQQLQLVFFIISGIFLLYVAWRWIAAWRSYKHWNALQDHRTQMQDWALEKKKQLHERKRERTPPPQT